MTMSSDEELKPLQQEVQRLLGRCLLRLQQYERQIKAIVAHHKISGPIEEFEQTRTAQIDDTARKTLGTLVGDLLGSYVVAEDIDTLEDAATNSPDNVNWIAMQITLSLSDAEFAKVESDLKELVRLRNNLVHHFIDQHDLWSTDGCRGAQGALVTAYDCIDHHFERLREWAEDMIKSQQALSEVLQSDEFRDAFVNGIAPDGKVNWDASGIVSALREAFDAKAVNGWALVDEAGKWITERYPEKLPAKYGCKSWRQVVHKATTLELRYLELDEQRTACYREKDRTP